MWARFQEATSGERVTTELYFMTPAGRSSNILMDIQSKPESSYSGVNSVLVM